MKPAAFSAVYADWKLIKTRAVVQLVFEIPVEKADLAYQVVGGMPNAGEEAWFAIARLANGADHTAAPREPEGNDHRQPAPAHSVPDASGAGQEARAEDTRVSSAAAPPSRREPKSWYAMTGAQQAGILAADAGFQKFCGAKNGDAAAEWIRQTCGVPSRSQIGVTDKEWMRIVSDYRAWMREPEVVG